MKIATLTQIGLAKIERRLCAEGYVCEIYSHMNPSRGVVYGYVLYTTDDDIKQLVCFDFGYTTLGKTECVALACVLRNTSEVQVKDFPVLHLDGDDDLAARCNNCDLYRPFNQKALQIGGPLLSQSAHAQHVQPHLTCCVRIKVTITIAISSNGELDKRRIALNEHRIR